MIKNVLKRQTTIIAITVIALCIGLIGISYAIFFDIDEGSPQTVTSGSLVVQFATTKDGLLTNGSSGTITEEEPMADGNGSTRNGYVFSVTNKGTLPMNYNVYLYDDPAANSAGTRLPHSYIKVKFDEEEYKTLDSFTCTDKPASELGETGDSNINVCQINTSALSLEAKGANTTHTIRIWISDSVGDSAENNIIALKAIVLGEA